MLSYVGALNVLMSVVPWTGFRAGHSPFIGMLALAGLGIAATVVNLVVRTSAISGIHSTTCLLLPGGVMLP